MNDMTWSSHNNLSDSGHSRPSLATRENRYHWVVLFLSFSLTLIAWYSTNLQNRQSLADHFKQEVDKITRIVSERLHKYELALWAGTAAIRANGDYVSFQTWIDFTERLEIEKNYPALNGIGIIHAVKPANLAIYLETQQKMRPGFRISPQHAESILLPVTYLEPPRGDIQAVGMDMAHNSDFYSAALTARDSGDAQLAGPFFNHQASETQVEYHFTAPFYIHKEGASVRQRRERFSGLVYAPFVVSELMQGLLAMENRNVVVRIFDDGENIYDEFKDEQVDSTGVVKVVDLDVYGRQWAIHFRLIDQPGIEIREFYSIAILCGGLVITFLLFCLFQAHVKMHRRARHVAEEMTAELKAQAEKLQRSNADLEQFAYVASHDLQEPLRLISNFTQLLHQRYHGQMDEKADVYIKHTVDSVAHMQQLLIDLLEYARVTSDTSGFKWTDLNEVVREVLSDLDGCIKRNHASVSVGDLPAVLGEKSLLHQVLQNLIHNALKFRDDNRELEITIQAKSQGEYWCISVEDTGIGMEEQYLDKIFVMFQRLHNRSEYQGSGVGLAICKKVVSLHGGSIRVRSTPGKGTVFYISFPK